MKDIERVLRLISQVVVDQFTGGLSAGPEGLGGQASLGRLALRTPDAEGILVEELRLGLREVELPSREDRSLSACVQVERLTVALQPPLFGRLAEFAKERLLARAGELFDRIELDDLQVRLAVSAEKKIRVEVWMERLRVLKGEDPAVVVSGVHLVHQDFTPGPDKKAALRASHLFLNTLTVRVFEGLMNRAVEVGKAKVPKDLLQSAQIDLGGSSMKITSKVKLFPVALPIEVSFKTEENRFGIFIVKIGLALARPVVLQALKSFSKKVPPEVTVGGDFIWVNPWPKIPVPTTCRATRFAVEDRQLVIEFARPADAPQATLGPDAHPHRPEPQASTPPPPEVLNYVPPLP